MYTDYTLILYASNSLRLRDCCNPNCSQLCGGTLQLYSEKLIQMPLLHINSCVIRYEHHHRWDKIWLCRRPAQMQRVWVWRSLGTILTWPPDLCCWVELLTWDRVIPPWVERSMRGETGRPQLRSLSPWRKNSSSSW